MHACVFLPLTRDTAVRLCRETVGQTRNRVVAVQHRAEEAEEAAAHCWTLLLAGCNTAGQPELSTYLYRLSETASLYAGINWWFSTGSGHRVRVADAHSRIETAITDGDGQEFAKAFIGYDHAVASAVMCAGNPAQQP